MNAQDLPALIKQAQQGDTDSFIQLYTAVYRPVYKIARMAMLKRFGLPFWTAMLLCLPQR